MSTKIEKFRINKLHPMLDRRRKLSDRQKANIIKAYATGNISTRQLAKKYRVSRRLIQFILDEQKRLDNVQKRRERGNSKIYYNKDKWREAMRDHRRYKRQLLNEVEEQNG
jgi:transposase-like protein